MREPLYVTHTCKNSKLKENNPNYCFKAFVDVDVHNSRSLPPTWKYCPDCVKKGFKNTKRKVLSEGQLKSLKNLKSCTEKIA